MTDETVEALIRRYVVLGKRSARGFEGVKCQKCNDYKVRGGFKFEGPVTVFSCFNCSTATVYDSVNKGMSKGMREVLSAFGIPGDEIDRAVNLNFFKEKASPSPLPQKKEVSLPVKEILFPPKTVTVLSGTSPWCEVAIEYLKQRSLDPVSFYISGHVDKYADYNGRVIIPYHFRGKLIYWQARAMDESIQPRYKNPTVEKDNIFFNMDELYRYTDDPLFICEGPLDALSIGQQGVALLGSTLTEFRIRELKKLKRKVTFVLDKNKNGAKLGLNVLRLGEDLQWFITVFPQNIDDANDALVKMGKLWMIQHLASSSVKGLEAKLLVEMNCAR